MAEIQNKSKMVEIQNKNKMANRNFLHEPSGIAAHDGKRPDGCTLIPWRAGRCLAWDVTVPGAFAERYVQLTSKESGLAATRASDEKIKKYDGALPSMEFLPICIERFLRVRVLENVELNADEVE
ncbi:hypothetical protein HELRODRAFT_167185 [Helobdella robusta]|uniref:Uncharacterized protein n=1 Tax=Helobdella robusta TaxID=6412 RepID=T1EZ40_HELRO|nr:hypothetical protein HELRODRAFT_167185 [Helobdella robusta]ESO10693.1 hypothetical protein HELRODRAFT_167185 [Helobdella robusta]